MQLAKFQNKKVAIWGIGKEGQSALKTLNKYLPQLSITILNDSPINPSMHLNNCKYIIGKDNISASIHQFDIIVKSPGISIYRPEITHAQTQGVLFTSATNIWFAENPAQKTICVTGTKGKSTTSSLLAHILKHQGTNVALGGNVGTPLLDLLDLSPKPDVWILEMSSYQTSDFTGTPFIAVLLNLFPEHLDWHGNVDNYFGDKIHLFSKSTKNVINFQDPNTRSFTSSFCAPIYFNHKEGIYVKSDSIYNQNTKLIDSQKIPLLGRHNLENICAALTALRLLDIDLTTTIEAISSFKGLSHRLYPVGEKNGVLYVDDSISTTPQSTMAAINSYTNREITLIVGGYDRGLDWLNLSKFLLDTKVKMVITIPSSGLKIARAIRELAPQTYPNFLYEAKDLCEAVKISQQNTLPGGIVLLSPAAPSYGQFKNFQERGNTFATLAGLEIENKTIKK